MDENVKNYSFDEIDVDPRFKVCTKEMLISLSIVLLHCLSCLFVVYGMTTKTVEGMKFIWGFPKWYVLISFISLIFVAISIYFTNNVFVHMELTDEGTILSNERKNA